MGLREIPVPRCQKKDSRQESLKAGSGQDSACVVKEISLAMFSTPPLIPLAQVQEQAFPVLAWTQWSPLYGPGPCVTSSPVSTRSAIPHVSLVNPSVGLHDEPVG